MCKLPKVILYLLPLKKVPFTTKILIPSKGQIFKKFFFFSFILRNCINLHKMLLWKKISRLAAPTHDGNKVDYFFKLLTSSINYLTKLVKLSKIVGWGFICLIYMYIFWSSLNILRNVFNVLFLFSKMLAKLKSGNYGKIKIFNIWMQTSINSMYFLSILDMYRQAASSIYCTKLFLYQFSSL